VTQAQSISKPRRIARLLAWLALGAAAGPLPAVAQDIADGTLLVASPELADPNFSQTVVLVLRHDDNGTIGVIVNRPTLIAPRSVFPDLTADVDAYPGKLFRGGPVAPTQLLFLVRGLAAATVQGPEILDKVFLTADPNALPDMIRLADGTADLRFYAGHAEWTAGQLEREIKSGRWHMVPGAEELLFDGEPGQLWSRLVAFGEQTVADVAH